MARTFRVGDHVSWNSETGRVSGRILRVHTKDVNYKGYIHHASRDDPQYAIKSDKTVILLCTRVEYCGTFATDRPLTRPPKFVRHCHFSFRPGRVFRACRAI